MVSKNKMTIKEFEKEQGRLLKNPEIRAAWLEYLSRFPHMSGYFRAASQFACQTAIVNGKKTGSDINLYKLFLEQCFNLLRGGGQCGIVIPSGIYTDLGAKGLRDLLFERTKITGLFCFENRKEIFEGVHRSYKFVVLTFERCAIPQLAPTGAKSTSAPPDDLLAPRGGTQRFPSAFMRHDIEELDRFPETGALWLTVGLIRKLSPDSHSVMEFKSEQDIRIAEKMLRFPLLGEDLKGMWNLALTQEFHMTNDSKLFKTQPGKGRLALYEGKMVHQFDHRFAKPRYWIEEAEARTVLLGKQGDVGQKLDYQAYRIGFRDVARNTDERTMIAGLLPPGVFSGNTLVTSRAPNDGATLIAIVALLDSFVVDSFIRYKVTAHCNMFYVYQLPVPRLTTKDLAFTPIVSRAAKLICTNPEFDDLANEVGLGSHKAGVTDPAGRARLRAELDGLITHLYGLTEEEFRHILSSFPLVAQPIKDAAMDAYREFAPKAKNAELAALLAADESQTLEFKSSARWNMKENKQDKAMEQVIVKTVAAFLNSEQGGTLLIGVDDDANVVGLAHDYRTLGKKANRDGYENWLMTRLLDEYGKDCAALISIAFHGEHGKDICRLAVKPSPRPVFVRDGTAEQLYIRAGNSTRHLTTKEAVEFCKLRWG